MLMSEGQTPSTSGSAPCQIRPAIYESHFAIWSTGNKSAAAQQRIVVAITHILMPLDQPSRASHRSIIHLYHAHTHYVVDSQPI